MSQKRFLIVSIAISLWVIGFFSNNLFAQTQLQGAEILVNETISKPVDEIIGAANTSLQNPNTYVALKIDDSIMYDASFRCAITLGITPFLVDGSPDDLYEKEIVVVYNNQGEVHPYADLSYHQISNGFGLQATIKTITITNLDTGSTIGATPPNVILETGFTFDAYKKLSEQQPRFIEEEINNGILELAWDPITGAKEYQVEWTWIDNYGIDSNGNTDITIKKPASAIDFTNLDFRRNSTRILTTENSYTIPLIYANGYLMYQVRAVGRFVTNSKVPYYGPWSNSEEEKQKVSNWDYKDINAHEQNKNWQFQASYAEEGKRKEVVSYFDGTLRNRQTVTKINSDDTPIVGEVIYDNQGRPAIEVLPAPVAKAQGNSIRYYENFNKVDATTPYTHDVFDWDSIIGECEVDVQSMGDTSGASKYYSSNGDTDPKKTFQDFVPNASGFPFSQIEYTPDNTGRISRKSGVGSIHKLGTGHEMKYFYVQPKQEELNRLFGYNVGDKNRYKKNMVVDPNGQVSISYIDPQGRTIATALAGKVPDGMDALPDQTNGDSDMFFDLLDKKNEDDTDTTIDSNEYFSTGNFGKTINDGLAVNLPLEVSEGGSIYEITYEMSANGSYSEICVPNTSYEYKYDLEISLLDECATNVFKEDPAVLGDDLVKNITTFAGKTFETKQLNVGVYQLNKRITVNEATVNDYVSNYVDNYECLLEIENFTPNVNSDACYFSCQDCINDLLGKDESYDNLFPSASELIIPKQLYVVTQITQLLGAAGFAYSNNELTYILSEDIANDPIEQTVFVSKVGLYEERFKKEFDLSLAACQTPCKLVSQCEVNELALLSDVSKSGQYGGIGIDEDFDENKGAISGFDEYSVFNENNLLGANKNWKTPALNYQNTTGEEFRIYLDETFTKEYSGNTFYDTAREAEYILPQQLVNIDDFLELWQPSWAKSLVSFHPEYCYLNYYNALCFANRDISIGFEVNTDTYDQFLIDKMQTVADADGRGGFFSIKLLDTPTSLLENDPYFFFSYTHDMTIAGYGTKDVRTAIMTEALSSNYSNVVDNSGVKREISMLKMAYVTVIYGNDLSRGLDISGLPSEVEILSALRSSGDTTIDGQNIAESQKEQIWEKYKFFYIGLKKKLINVFANIYAKQQGCYNGCIGRDGNPAVVTVLQDFSQFSQLSQMFKSGPSNILCLGDSSKGLSDKTKRFAPVDNLYDSGVTTKESIENLATETDYEIWTQTGKCPLAFDMEYFLNGLAEDGRLIENVNTDQINYLVPDLYNALSKNLSQSGSVLLNPVVNAQTLTITIGDADCSTSLVLPDGLSWSNYQGTGITGWRLQNFKNFTFSEYNASNQTFGFEVLATVIPADTSIPEGVEDRQPYGIIEEYLITGVTCAPIGECSVESNGVGEQLSNQTSGDNGNGCTKKSRFEKSLTLLLNELNTKNRLITSSLSDETVYTSGMLPQFLGDYAKIALWDKGIDDHSFTIKTPLEDFLTLKDIAFEGGGFFNFGAEPKNESFLGVKVDGTNIRIRIVDANHEIQTLTGKIYYKTNSTLDFACGCDGEQKFSRNEFLIEKLNALINYVHHNFDKVEEGFVPEELTDLAQYLNVPTGVTLGIFDKVNTTNTYSYYLAKTSNGNAIYKLEVVGENPFGLQYLRLDKENFLIEEYFITIQSVEGVLVANDPASIDTIRFESLDFCSESDSSLDLDCPIIGTIYKYQNNEYEKLNSVFAALIKEDGLEWARSFLEHREYEGLDGYGFSSLRYFFDYYDSPVIKNWNSSYYDTDIQDSPPDEFLSATFSVGDNSGKPDSRVGIQFFDGYAAGETDPSYSPNIVFTGVSTGGIGERSLFNFVRKNFITGEYIRVGTGYIEYPVCRGIDIGIPDNMDGKDSCAPITVCNEDTPCIPTPILPIPCNPEYERFITDISTQLTDYQLPFYFTNDEDAEEVEDRYKGIDYFCKLNYGYLVQPYLKYLRDLNITSVEDENYLRISDFGATDLNFGYPQIDEVIEGFVSYKQANPTAYDWQLYVNLVYMTENDVCPPTPLPVLIDVDVDPEVDNRECTQYLANIQGAYSREEYNAYLTRLRETFRQNYIKSAMQNLVEKFTMVAPDREYQYTLYYYDQAGNLVQTVPPEGVHRPTDELGASDQSTYHANVNEDRTSTYFDSSENNSSLPKHRLETKYRYNSLNQLVWQYTPDGGVTRFAYDALGRIIASQNAKQLARTDAAYFSYTSYDALGRIIEAGELVSDTAIQINDNGDLVYADGSMVTITADFPGTLAIAKNEVTKTIYDRLLALELETLFDNYEEATTRNRVTAVLYFETYTGNSLEYDNAIFYNYDIHGNVKELITDHRHPDLVAVSQHQKHVNYEYDLISGNVNKVIYQKDQPDQFIHKYVYDADNRITTVATSTDGVIWEQDASYEYYAHGPLARTIIGDKQVQGMDYAYTLQGWLKGVNSEEVGVNDIGNDGSVLSSVAKDAMAYSLNYYQGDYTARNTSSPFTKAAQPTNRNEANLYNGNIKTMITSLLDHRERTLDVLQNNYQYDQLNRIKNFTSINESNKQVYTANYSYDNNGNLTLLQRSAQNSNGILTQMDNLTYNYNEVTVDEKTHKINNQLRSVYDEENLDANFSLDLKSGQELDNYVYDPIGQLIEDKKENLKIDWRVDGKVKRITKQDDVITFVYDGLGNRIAKTTAKNDTKTYYVRDAQGNTLAVYSDGTVLSDSSCQEDLLIDNTFTGTGLLKATNQITVTKTIDPSISMTLQAGNAIIYEPGAHLPQGTVHNGLITEVTCDTGDSVVAEGLQLKEHHIYGSSRLGLQESDLVLGDPRAAAKMFVADTSNDKVENATAESASFNTNQSSTGTLVNKNGIATNALGEDIEYGVKFSSATYGSWSEPLLFETGRGKKPYYLSASIKMDAIPEPNFLGIQSYIASVNYEYIDTSSNAETSEINRIELFVSMKDDKKYYPGINIYSHIVNTSETNFIQVISDNGFIDPVLHLYATYNPVDDSVELQVNGNTVSLRTVFDYETGEALNKNDNRISLENVRRAVDFSLCSLRYGVPHSNQYKYFPINEGTGNRIESYRIGRSTEDITPDPDPVRILLNSINNIDDLWIPNACSNIPDADADGIADVDEYDANNDGTGSATNPDDTDGDQIPNYLDPDDDNDGILTINEVVSTDDAIPNHLDIDDDNDGINTINELATSDTDGDGILNYLDPDDDGDGVNTIYEGADNDTDQDVLPNYLDNDDDGDTVLTQYEGVNADGDGNPTTGILQNTDGDASPDYLDPDDDNDGYVTNEENPDPNQDGNPEDANNTDPEQDLIPDYLDDSHNFVAPTGPIVKNDLERIIGDKRYELSNHLGNVMSVISDRKLVSLENGVTSFTPDVLSFSDYYPFGSLLPGRHGNSGDYRYGFQGQEMDNEIKGEGNSYNFKHRMSDPRIGRFFAPDPLEGEYPELTPYQFASNSPIALREIEGLEGDWYVLDLRKEKSELQFNKTVDYWLIPNSLETDYITVEVPGPNNSYLSYTFTAVGSGGQAHNGELGSGNYLGDFGKFKENPLEAILSGEFVTDQEILGDLVTDVVKAILFRRLLKSTNNSNNTTGTAREKNSKNRIFNVFNNRSNLPGKKGIEIEGRLSTEKMKELTNRFGVEFAQVYKLGPGKNGAGGKYYLYSGDATSVKIDGVLDGNSILINHTHPAGAPFASPADRKLLDNIEKSGSPQRSSEIIPIGRDKNTRFNKDGKNTTDKNESLKSGG